MKCLRAALAMAALVLLSTPGQGIAETPPAAAARRGDRARYRLPPTRAGVGLRRWRYVVVHHSGTAGGSARAFEAFHRGVRHMPRGMAYHFVIGNGHGLADGAVEAGPRWTLQQPGAHVASALRDGDSGVAMDEVALGISLVGDLETSPPTPRQLRSLRSLLAALRRTFAIPRERVLGHNEVRGAHTACPGRHLPIASLRADLEREESALSATPGSASSAAP